LHAVFERAYRDHGIPIDVFWAKHTTPQRRSTK